MKFTQSTLKKLLKEKLNLNEMAEIKGLGDGQDFLAGFACTAGILTATTGLGLALAFVGCSTLIGNNGK
ncbi:hypothetical protein H4K35_10360 [Myroides sp. NP-2]|uniref:hypothetical protein n=1 Tax=Myroides sp. NP-2 TaxID=2759945 RepID=UPI0015FC7420|nr:hypothetical protein [Myroides sp. NP-2]MBB1150513.1 hypothetical protein [Myroides sp. NP-2]